MGGARDRSSTLAEKKSLMSKNLIVEDDEDLVDETDAFGTTDKKDKEEDDNDDYSEDADFD